MDMLVNRATGLRRDPISRPIRRGKTAKDRANGNAKRSYERRLARASWVQETRSKHYSSEAAVPRFPS